MKKTSKRKRTNFHPSMFLRTSISSTKKFFQKTIENFKSFISGGYQKLPKSPPSYPFRRDGGPGNNSSQRYKKLDKYQLDGENEKVGEKGMKKIVSRTRSRHEHDAVRVISPENRNEKRSTNHEARRRQDLSNTDCVVKQRRSYLVVEKLKELEMVDKSNVEHVLDIEEVLYYYSRLTCPAYVDIVDRFFMDIYSEIFRVQASSWAENLKPSLCKQILQSSS